MVKLGTCPPTGIVPPEPESDAGRDARARPGARPALRERQAETEAAGRVLDETQAALVDAGLYRAMQPRRFGGYEFGLADFVRVMSEVSRGCPSTGWSVTLTAGHPQLLSHWEEQAQAEIYGRTATPAFRAARCSSAPRSPRTGATSSAAPGTTPPAATMRRTSWAAPSSPGSRPPRLTWLLIDRADFTIVDNWDVIGLRGTGSKRVVCENVFVPEHRVSRRSGRRRKGRRAGARTPTRSTPAGCSRSCSSSSARSRSAPRAARSTSTRRSCENKPIDIPPFVAAWRDRRVPPPPRRGDRPRRRRRGCAAVGDGPLSRAGGAGLRGRPARSTRTARRHGACSCSSSRASASHPKPSTCCSEPAGPAPPAAATRSGTRCSRCRSCAPTWACSGTEHSPTSAPAPRPGGRIRLSTPAELIAAAEALRPRLLDEQAATEERTCYSEELHETFETPGFYRMLVPRRYGGLEVDLPTFYRVIMSIARGCPSTGWMLTLGTAHSLQFASYWSRGGPGRDLRRRTLRRARPASRFEDAVAVPVDGGYRVTGTWHFCSGVPFATHHMGLTPAAGGRPAIVAVDPARELPDARQLGRPDRPQGQRLAQRRGRGRVHPGAPHHQLERVDRRSG